jgi:hypothetical protein
MKSCKRRIKKSGKVKKLLREVVLKRDYKALHLSDVWLCSFIGRAVGWRLHLMNVRCRIGA